MGNLSVTRQAIAVDQRRDRLADAVVRIMHSLRFDANSRV